MYSRHNLLEKALMETPSNNFLFKHVDNKLYLFEMEKIIELDDISKMYDFQMFDYIFLL